MKYISTLLCQVYIPCCLFVLVSWISFIIEPTVELSPSPAPASGLTLLDVSDCPRPDVPAGDSPAGPGQRVQQCPSQRPLLWSLKTQRHRRLLDDLHLHGLQRHRGVRLDPRHPDTEA